EPLDELREARVERSPAAVERGEARAEERLALLARRDALRLHRALERAEEVRHRQHARRAARARSLRDLVREDRLDVVHLTARVQDGEEAAGQLEHVVQREHREEDVLLPDPELALE